MRFLVLLFILLIPHAWADECVTEQELQSRSVIIEKYGRGAGSGVLLDGQHILTAYHVVDDIEKIWVRLPDLGALPVPAYLLRHDAEADIALLRLEEELPNVARLTVLHGEQVYPNMRVFLGAYAFADRSRFGMVEGHYIAPARLKADGPVSASFIELKNRTFGGDSGGGVYTCFGDLMGIEIGNMAREGRPNQVAAVSPGFIQWILVPPRAE